MADKKITQLTNITGANLADADEFVVVDITADETKAITFSELKTAFDTGTGFVRITGDTMTGDLSFGDNDKAIFGAGSDLQIYHDGSNSYITDVDTGNLYLEASAILMRKAGTSENIAKFIQDNRVELYYDNASKLTTTATGIDVTGTVTSDGLTVDGTSGYVRIQDLNASVVSGTDMGGIEWRTADSTVVGANRITATINVEGDETFNASDKAPSRMVFSTHGISGASPVERMRISYGGDISFYEDTGTTAKFFWDASAESLGIGTASPDAPLHIIGNDGVQFNRSGQTNGFIIRPNASSDGIRFTQGGTGDRMIIDSSGNVGIGTSSPSNSLHIASTDSTVAHFQHTDGINSHIRISDTSDSLYLVSRDGIGSIGGINSSSNSNLNIDLTSGNVGIGTSSPSAGLELNLASGDGLLINSADIGTIKMKSTAGTVKNWGFATTNLAASDFGIYQSNSNGGDPITAGTAKMYFNSSGNVGIGTSSPNATLTVSQSSNNIFAVERTGVSSGSGQFGINIETNSQATVSYDDGAQLVFGTASSPSTHAGFTERMRIDSSGNVLVGTTDNNVTNNSGNNPGINIGVAGIKGFISSARYQGPPLSINRLGNDGDIQLFSKDGTTVGSIGTANSGDLYIGNDDTTLLFAGGSDAIIPRGTAGATRDAAIDLGLSAHRFKNGYFSGSLYGDGSNLTGVGGSTTAGAVGTYALIGDASGGSHYSHGATISGSLLDRAYSVYNFEYATITARSGTWRCMGYSGISVYGTLWLRIS